MADELDFDASLRRSFELEKAPPAPALVTPLAQQKAAAAPPALDFDTSLARANKLVDEDTKLKAQFLKFRQENSPLAPESTAEIFRTAAALRDAGETPSLDFVRDNLPALKQRVDASGAQWDTILAQHPEVADYLLAEPARQDLVADDLKNVDGLAWAFKAIPEHIVRHQVLEQEFFGRTFAESKGVGSEANRLAIQDLEKKMAGGLGAEHWYSKVWAGTLNMLPMLARYAAVGIGGAKLGAVAAAPVAGATAVETAGAGPVIAETAGAAAGAKIATGLLTYYETVGPAYWRLVKAGIRPTIAHTLAEFEGSVTGAIFAGAGTALLGRLGIGGKAFAGEAAAVATEEVLAKKTVGQVLAKAGIDYGKNVGHAMLMMGAIGAVSQTTTEIAGWADHGEEISAKRIGAAVADSMESAVRDMALIAAYAPAREFLGNVGEAIRIGKDHEQLLQAIEATENSKLLERSPDEFKVFLATLGQRGLKTMYSPIEDFNAYWQKRRADPRAIAAKLVGDDGKAYDHALSTGGDLPLRADNYLPVLGKTEHARGLSADIKLRPDGKTPRQEQARLERRAAEIAKIPDHDMRMEEGRDLVERWFTESIDRTLTGNKRIANAKANAQKNGKLAAAAFDRMAREINSKANEGTEPITGWQLFREKTRLELLGQKGVRAGDIAAEAHADPAVLAKLEQFHAGLSDAQKYDAYYRDRNTGLLSERGHELVGRDATRPFTAVFSFEGKKPANDKVGHLSVDGALRTMGRVLDEGHIRDGVKRGGNVEADVRDQTHADELADAMSKELGVRVRATAVERAATVDATLRRLGPAHDAAEKTLVDAKAFAERGEVPVDYAARPAEFEAQAAKWMKEGDAELAGNVSFTDAAVARRADITDQHARHYGEVGPEQSFYETYRTEHGHLNDLGFHRMLQLEKPQHVVSADMRGIGKMNEAFGRAKTNIVLDALLEVFAQKGAGDFNLAHLHGDELGAAGNDVVALGDFFARVRKVTDRLYFYGSDDKGGFWLQRGVHFAYGFGADFDRADRVSLPDEKAKQNVPAPERFNTGEELGARLKELGSAGSDYDAISLDDIAQQRLRQREARPGSGEVPAAGADAADLRGSGDPEARREDVALDGTRAPRGRAAGQPGARGANDGAPLEGVLRGPAEVATGRAYARKSSVLTERAYSHWDAFEHVFESVGGADASPSQQADGKYRAFLAKKGPRPPPFEKGHYDDINKELGRAPDKGVSGAYEAWIELSRKFAKSQRWDRLEPVIAMFRETVPGLEKLRLPEEVEQRLGERSYRDGIARELGVSLKQPGTKGPRGSITFELPHGGSRPRRYVMDLDGADESTAAHETIHMLSEVMHDVAAAADAPPALKADYEALLKWMGHGSPEERVAAHRERVALERKAENGKLTDAEEARRLELEAKEERVAVGWETYLMEGKSPSARLADVFSRFGGWLAKIYRASSPAEQYRKNFGKDLGLTPEVRAIFDRLLATEDELDKTRQAYALQPLPIAQRNMTPEEREEDRRLTEQMQQDGRNKVLAAIARDKAERSKVVEEERDRLTAERNLELDRQPIYRALSFLQDREYITIDERGQSQYVTPPEWLQGEDGKTLRLNRKAIDGSFGAGAWKTLPAGTTVEKGGVDPGELAEAFGFDNSEALIRALQLVEPRDKVIRRDVDERLQRTFGPALVDDPNALFEEATAGVQSEADARRIMGELRSMRRELDPDHDPRVEVVTDKARKELAKRLISERAIREIVPSYYRQAGENAAKRAHEASMAGNLDKAQGERETQLFNQHLYRYARAADELADHIKEQLEKKTSHTFRAGLGKAVHVETLPDGSKVEHRDYLDAHDALLAAVGIGRRRPQDFRLDDLFERMNLDAAEVVFDTAIVRDILEHPKPYAELTVPEATELGAAIKNIRASAMAVNEVLVGEKRLSVKGIVDGIRDQLEQLPFLGKEPAAKQQVSAARRAALALQGADGGLIDPIEMFESMGGRAKEFFIDRYIDARTKRDGLEDKVLGKVFEAWQSMPEDLRNRRHEVIASLRTELPIKDELNMDDAAGPRDRQWLWMLYLNLGNEGPKSNTERVLRPFGWTREQALASIGKHLTADECEFLQKVLTLCDTELWPEISAKEQRKYGLAPEKIEASPITIAFADGSVRTYAGGYFPARYRRDAAVGDIAERQAESAIASFYGPTYERATTPKSHTKARAAGYANVVDLDWSVVTNHLAQVVHDVSFDEYVRDTARVLMHPDLQNAIYQRFGAKRSVQPREWLKAVANAFADAVPESMRWWQNLINPLRNRTIWSAIGGSIPVALGDLTNGPLATWYGDISVEHGTGALVKGYAQAAHMLVGKSEMRNFAVANSVELRHRARHNERRIKKEVELIGKKQSGTGRALDRAQMMLFSMQEATDALASTVIWTGAFNEARAKGGETESASRHADDIVRHYLPSHDVGEQSAVLRDKRGIGSLLLFHGWFNKRYNMNRRALRGAAGAMRSDELGAGSKTFQVALAAGRVLGAFAVFGAGAELLSGRGQGQDEKLWQWLLRKSAGDALGELPFGTVASPLVDYAVTGSYKPASVRSAPGISVIESAVQAFGRLASGKGDHDKRVWDAIELLILAIGGPARQTRRTGEYLDQLVHGHAEHDNWAGVTSGVIYGERANQPANPLTPFAR